MTTLILAILAVVVMLYAGIDGLLRDYSYGAMLTFIGAATAMGLVIDIYNHVNNYLRAKVKKSNYRKLGL